MGASSHLAATIYATICVNNADAEELLALLGGGPTAFTPQYTLDDAVVDTAETAAALVFSTIALLVAHAEAASETSITVRVMPPTMAPYHDWDGASSGYAAGSSLSIYFTGVNRAYSAIDIHGVFPVPAVGVFPNLSFSELAIKVSAATSGLCTERSLWLSGVAWNGTNQTFDMTGATGQAYDSDMFRARFVNASFWGLASVSITQGLVGPTFDLVGGLTWVESGSVFVEQTSAFGVLTAAGGGPVDASVTNVAVDVDDTTNVGAYSVFNIGAGNFAARGVTFCRKGTASAVTLINATAILTQPYGVTPFLEIPAIQLVVATGDTWNGVSPTVVLDSSAIGAAGAFNLPASATSTDGFGPLIINEDGANSVDIAKNGGDTINLAAGPIATGAVQSAIKFTNRAAATNWMIS
jgi:hypothetical protein